MAAKLENCPKEEQQSVICFLWAGVPGGQIHQGMWAQYWDNALSHRIVYEWTEIFKNGHRSVTDAERSGCPTTAKLQRMKKELGNDSSKQKSDDWRNYKTLNISIGSTYSVVYDNLQFHKECARWVPKDPTNEHNCMCLDICSCHLGHYSESDNFLQWIATGDETWVHHYQPETKWMSIQWKQRNSRRNN
jgi:hypothetical protein